MQFSFDGRRVVVSGKNLVVETAAGETVITEREPASGGSAPASSGAKRGRKPKSAAGVTGGSQTSFEPNQLQS